MVCIVLAESETTRCTWQLLIEDLAEDHRCLPAANTAQALLLLQAQPADVLLLIPGMESTAMLTFLQQSPPLAPPYLLGLTCDAPDGCIREAADLPGLLQTFRQEGQLPALCSRHLRPVTILAQGMLKALGIPARLRAWEFLPDMAALTVVHPPLLHDLTHFLYPLVARRYALTPGAVERRLRLCIESTWSRSSLAPLERFFGHSVDPERGKPTNREFLCRVQERLTLAAGRMTRA